MLEHEGYLSSLNKARRKHDQNVGPRYLLLLLAAVILVGLIAVGIRTVKKPTSRRVAGGMPLQGGQITTSTQAQAEGLLSPKEETAREGEEETDKTISPRTNLDIMWMSGYLSIRETPSAGGKIISKLSGNGVCETLDTEGGWPHITSGDVDGYISSQYPLTEEEARAEVKEPVKLRATVTADNLNTRQTPELDPSNVVRQALKDERYVVLGQQDGWIQTEESYISADYADTFYSLNEGRELNMKAMAINQYDNLVISKVNSYLNMRAELKQDGEIIGRMISKAAGEIPKALDGWYKIKSDPIIDYVSTDPQSTTTCQEAEDIAIQTAALKAVINTGVPNMRMEPNMDSKIWIQIIKDERYPVVAQLDGQVETELNSVDEEDESIKDKVYISIRDNSVEVHYALDEATKLSPQEITTNGAAFRRSQIVNYALQFVENPCVQGGTSLTEGADCPGFIMKVMEHFGVSLPHYSGSQAKMGKAVTSGNMGPGDLIFYAGSSREINHVSTYIDNGQVVRAASRGSGIEISAWNCRSPVAIRNVPGD